MERCLLSGPLADKTRILVTHALHILARTDYIYVMENGVIAERGTYQELMRNGQAFAKLVEEFGAQEEEDFTEEEEKEKKNDEQAAGGVDKIAEPAKEKTALMSEEERNRGAVPLSTYAAYLKHAGGIYWAPMIFLLLTLSQGASGELLLGLIVKIVLT